MSLVPPSSASAPQRRYVRFERLAGGGAAFGTLRDDTIAVCAGDLFGDVRETPERVTLDSVRLLAPTQATKMIGLWNNFAALAEKLELSHPAHPLYFIKAPSAFMATEQPIVQPRSYQGRVVFEAELGIVIGKTCKDADEAAAAECIFGYTCVNDVTAIDVLNEDPTFAQWTRAKSYDTFGVFGPVVATGLDPERLTIKAILDGVERQRYAASDMLLKPVRLVSLLSRDMTLLPGDVIACGTSLGAGKMKIGSTIEVTIDGIGTLRNTLVQAA